MADSKISALTALATTPAAGDLLVLVDVSDTTMAASGTDKKITFTNLTGTFLSATGATTGATAQAQTFTTGIVTASMAIGTTLLATRILNQDASLAVAATGEHFGVYARTTLVPSANVAGTMYGASYGLFPSNTAYTYATMYGVQSVLRHDGSGAITSAEAIDVQMGIGSNSGTITTLYGIRIAPFKLSGTITTLYGLYLAAVSQGSTNNYAIYTNAGLVRFGDQVLFAASTTTRSSANIVAGTAPTTPVAGDIWNDGALSFYNADATTNAIVNHLRLSRDSTGTAAAGLGLGILAELESTTTSRQSAGRLTWEWATATHASRAAKGKLTAYYTSTEREAITWVADSSSARVGIMNASPAAMLHVGAGADSPTISETIGYFSNAGTTAIAVRDSTNDAEAVMYISSSGAIYGTMTSHPVYFRTANNDVLSILANGNVGIGVTSPQGKLHGHDGSGGFLFVNQASVGGTLVTVIPDAAGDVTEKIFFVGWCTNSAPFSADVAPTTLAVSSSTTKTDGTNTLTIAVTAGGAFTLQATGGAATWNVNLWVFWR